MSKTSETPDDLEQPCSSPGWRFQGCPGLGYTVGAVGGSAYHFAKAFCGSPNGQRFISGLHGVRLNALATAGSVGFWAGGVFTASQWGMRWLRQEDDLWNSTVAGTVSGMLYNMRRGLVPGFKFGMCCGAAVCMIEGVSILVQPTPGRTTSLFSAISSSPKKRDETSSVSIAGVPESFDQPSPTTLKNK